MYWEMINCHIFVIEKIQLRYLTNHPRNENLECSS